MISCGEISQKFGINLTQSTAVLILCQYPCKSEWVHPEEYEAIKKLVVDATDETLPSLTKSNTAKRDNRPYIANNALKMKDISVYTDYEFGYQSMKAAGIPCVLGPLGIYPPVSGAENLSYHNFLFLMTHVKDFTTLPSHQRVAQFPFEGGFVRKDLLPLTVRTYCGCPSAGTGASASVGASAASGHQLPVWFNPCFDLSTELHFFMRELLRRHALGLTNNWIFKPSQGSRALGHKVIVGNSFANNNSTNNNASVCPSGDSSSIIGSLLDAVSVSSLTDGVSPLPGLLKEVIRQFTDLANYNSKKDAVAQLIISNPLTVRGRKFDMRCVVFVRSFAPFEAYFNQNHFARLANKLYNASALHDEEVMLSVNAYHKDLSISSQCVKLTNQELKEELCTEFPALDHDAMMLAMTELLRELFSSVAPSIGEWPRSSAYYAVDIMFDCDGCGDLKAIPVDAGVGSGAGNARLCCPTPKLLEVNYMGDWKGVHSVCGQLKAESGGEREKGTGQTDGGSGPIDSFHCSREYLDFVRDFVQCVATSESMDSKRNVRL